jgi:hypothetical protein
MLVSFLKQKTIVTHHNLRLQLQCTGLKSKSRNCPKEKMKKRMLVVFLKQKKQYYTSTSTYGLQFQSSGPKSKSRSCS